MHQQKDLDRIWSLIKPSRGIFADSHEYIGLKEVPFDLNREKFEKDYKETTTQLTGTANKAHVTQRISYASRLLRRSDIKQHHLSCVGEIRKDVHENKALCIHYENGGIRKSIAILGIDYTK